jgi:hypothetical protein
VNSNGCPRIIVSLARLDEQRESKMIKRLLRQAALPAALLAATTLGGCYYPYGGYAYPGYYGGYGYPGYYGAYGYPAYVGTGLFVGGWGWRGGWGGWRGGWGGWHGGYGWHGGWGGGFHGGFGGGFHGGVGGRR